MKFKINNLDWEIIKLDNCAFHELRRELGKQQNEQLREDMFCYGFTNPVEQKIYLNTILCEQQLRQTLIHELIHCWLWSYGASYTSYSEDALCDTVSASYDFIHKIIDEILSKGEKK